MAAAAETRPPELRVEPFDGSSARYRRAVEADAATIADHVGADDVELEFG